MRVVLLVAALLLAVATADACTKDTCASLTVTYLTRGDVDLSSTSVRVGGQPWFAPVGTKSSSKRLVPAGETKVEIAGVAKGEVVRLECMDLVTMERKTGMAELTTTLVAGHSARCIAVCFGKAQKGKRVDAPGLDADVSMLNAGTNLTEVGSTATNNIDLIITNVGKDIASGLVINDVVDDRLTITAINFPFVTSLGTAINCPQPTDPGFTNNITCTIPGAQGTGLAVNEFITISIFYTAPAAVTDPTETEIFIQNVATVTAETPDIDTDNNINFNNITIVVNADISVGITGVSEVVAGASQVYMYTLDVCNNGLSNAINVTASWEFPPDLLFQGQPVAGIASPTPISPVPVCTINGQTITCDGFDLPSPTSEPYCVPISIGVAVLSTAQGPTGGTINIQGSAFSEVFDSALSNNNQTFPVLVKVEADIRVTKSGDLFLYAGDEAGANFDIVVSNGGPSQAYGVFMIDIFPPEFQPYNATTEQGSCTIVGQNVTCDIGDLRSTGPESSIAIRLQYRTPADQTPTIQFPSDAVGPNNITNNAFLVSGSTDNNRRDNIDPHQVDIVSIAAVFVEKTCPETVISGETTPLQYVISIGNGGFSVARDVRIWDQIPAEYIIQGEPVVSGPATCDPVSDRWVNCSVTGDLPPAGNDLQINITINVVAIDSITEETVVPNTVNAFTSTFQNGAVVGNPTLEASCTSVIQPPPNLTILKGGPSGILVNMPNQVYQYSVTIINQGPTTAANVSFVDTVSSLFNVRTDLVNITGGDRAYDYATNCAAFGSSGNVFNCNFGSVSFGSENIVVIIPFTVPENTPEQVVENCATVFATLDINPNDNEACHNITLTQVVDVTVMKSTAGLCAGETGVYTITVMNAGPATAQNVNITDNFSTNYDQLSFQTPLPAGVDCSFNGQELFCDLPDLAASDSVQIFVDYRVPSSFRGLEITNMVTVRTSSIENADDRNNTYTDVNSVQICPDMSIEKTGTDTAIAGTIQDGDVLNSYTLTITNWGPSDAEGVRISDTFPAGFVGYQYEATGGAACMFPDGLSIMCTWPDAFQAPPNQRTETVTIFYRVLEDVVAGTYNNTGNVFTSDTDIFLPNNTDTHPVVVRTVAPIVVTKDGPSPCITAGSGVGGYTITVTNEGPSRAYQVRLEDTIPQPFNLVVNSLTVTGDLPGGAPACEVIARTITCSNWGSFRPNDTVTVTYDLDVDSSERAQEQIENVATASSICSTLNCERVSVNATYFTNICAEADLSVVKSASSGPFVAGDSSITHSFTLAVKNDGPSFAYDVNVTDFGFTGGDISSITSAALGACDLATLTCSYPQMTDGQSDTITVVFTIPSSNPCGTFPNNATIGSATTSDPDTSNNDSSLTIDIVAEHDVQVEKAGPGTLVAGGAPGTFTVTVTNAGPSSATDVVLTDNVPAPMEVFGTVSGTNCGHTNNVVTCNFGTMADGQVEVVVYSVRVAADGETVQQLENTACAFATNFPSCESEIGDNNCGKNQTDIICEDSLSITKDDEVSEIVAGDGKIYTFTMMVSNGGPSTSRTVTVEDSWPIAYSLVGFPITNSTNHLCLLTNRVMSCVWTELGVGETIMITQRYEVASNVPPQNVTNMVTAVGTCSNSNTVTASDTNEIFNNADISIIKDDCDDRICAGVETPNVFTFTIHNAGPSDAINLKFTDLVPELYQIGAFNTLGELQPTCSFSDIGGYGIECIYAMFPVNYTAKITLAVTVDSDAMGNQNVTNCAQVVSDVTDPNLCNNEDCDTNFVCTEADLEITKKLLGPEDTCIVAGNLNASTYEINIVNHGPSTARDVTFSESFPEEVEVLSVPAGCVQVGSSKNYTCKVLTTTGNLLKGERYVVSFDFRIAASAHAGIINNVVAVWSQTFDPELCNNNFTLPSLVCVYSDLSITKDDSYRVVTAGDGIVRKYVFKGFNFGPSDAKDVVIDDVWPNWGPDAMPGFDLLEIVGANCSYTDKGFVCRLGELKAGEGYEFCASYVVDSCTMACELCNAVKISSDSVDPNIENDSDIDCNEVRTEADLEICKSDGVDVVVAGDGVTYTYTMQVSNNGPSCALDVSVVDHFPAEVFQVPGSLSVTTGSCSIQNPSLGELIGKDFSCNLGVLKVNQTETIWVSYTVPSNATTCSITNVVTAQSPTFDPVQCNNDAKDVNAVLEKVTLEVTKEASSNALPVTNRGENIYTVTVSNNQGPSTASDVVLTDLWPATLCQFPERIHTTQGSCVSTGGDITCQFGQITVGQSVVVTIPFSVCDKSVAGKVNNTVSVFSPTDEDCRSATHELTLYNEKRMARPVRQTPRQAVRSTVPKHSVVKRFTKKDVKKAEGIAIDMHLPPVHGLLSASHIEGNKYSVKATNPNIVAVKFTQLNAHMKMKNGDSMVVDMTKVSKEVVATTCTSFAARKLPRNWSEECEVTFAKDLEIASMQFMAGGVSRTTKGNAPVLAQTRA